MKDNFSDIALLSIYSIILSNISISKSGDFISIIGVVIALLLNILTGSEDKNPGSFINKWFQQLSLCCLISISAIGLSKYLEYYDNVEKTYVHLIPTAAMPMLLPNVVVIVISVLVALGLEASYFLNIIAATLFVFSFALFFLAAIPYQKRKLKIFTVQQDTFYKIERASVFWYSAFPTVPIVSFNINIQRFVVTSVYLLAIYGFSVLPLPSDGIDLSYIRPLAFHYTWYQLLQVPLVACCLSLTIYLLYLPAVNGFKKIFWDRFQIKNMFTSLNLIKSVLTTGSMCCILIYFFSNDYLIILCGSGMLFSQYIATAITSISNYQPSKYSGKPDFKIKKAETAYRHIKSTNALSPEDLSKYNRNKENEDSGRSSDEDIDGIVEEYKEKIKIMKPFDKTEPNTLTGVIAGSLFIGISALSLVLNYTLQTQQFQYAIAIIAVILIFAILMYYQPANNQIPIIQHTSQLLFCTSALVLVTNVISSVWLVLSIWSLIGGGVYYKLYYKTFKPKIFPAEKLNFKFNEFPHLAIKTKLQTVQTPSNLI